METQPRNVIVLPVLYEGEIKAVIELASLYEFTASHLAFLEQLTGSIGVVLNTIEATMRTEGLLKQSQELAGELQTQQVELQQTNEEMATKARLLAEQNAEVERKNQEIEQARKALEEKAAELALTSRYKTEFLANMSHELRTPLNSILILGQQLSENPESNLSARQVEFAKTIHAAGTDLLNLISDILDLSKIESGTVTVESEELAFSQLRETIDRNFRHEAESRHLTFTTDFDPRLGRHMVTDAKRLMQIVKNLLSNAMKFTAQGSVRLHVGPAMLGWSADHPVLSQAKTRGRVRGHRHRHRHLAGEAEDHLRGLPAGRCRHGAQVRRHGPRARHQPRARAPAGRRNPAQELAGRGQHVHALSTARLPGRGLRARHHAHVHQAAVARRCRRRRCRRRTSSASRTIASPSRKATARCSSSRTSRATRRMLLEAAHGKGFKVLVAQNGADALSLARKYQPDAITLDVFLPDMLGWTVLNQLKHDPATRHIPVQVLTVEEERQYGLERGAFSFMTKPTTRRRPAVGVHAHPGIHRAARARAAGRSRTIRPNR